MAVGDKQKLITEIVGQVLGQTPQLDKYFDWFINKHTTDHFGKWYSTIDSIFFTLNGDLSLNKSKRTQYLKCDAFFAGEYNFIFEFDEFQHFSSARLKSLELYPTELKFNFSIEEWKRKCVLHKNRADRYRKSKTATDFNFQGGRTSQRAYLDCFRDLLPQEHELRPTLRINEFEVEEIFSNNKESCLKLEKLLKTKLNF